ncbi:UNVERIFIED_CONTAM: Stachyose synthase [Sesamum calycinum]|uniref:Stachyose synthase n=1 Tax=Sesamum calycinum TaxID=2727403 RepID=A0AAW2R9P6_9LAMI
MHKSVDSNAENGAFLGLSVKDPLDRILNPIGKFSNRKFLSIFRFKTWWSTMWVGSNGSDLQMETQLVILQVPELNSYVLILPLIEGNFRSAIHPGNDGEVLLSVESGSTQVKGNSFTSCAYLHIGNNPYDLMRDAFAAVRVHLGTWVWHGVKSLAENGIPPKFLIIDDGWQSINMDHEDPFQDSKDLTGLGSQMLCRLYRFKENEKFANYQAGTILRPDAPQFDQENHDNMFKEMIELAKRKKALKEAQEDFSLLRQP